MWLTPFWCWGCGFKCCFYGALFLYPSNMNFQTPVNQAVFRVEAAICRLFRDTLTAKGFVEFHSPKIIPGKDGGEVGGAYYIIGM